MQPAEGIFFIHEAITHEAAALEQAACSAQSQADAAKIPDRLSFFGHVLKLHTDGEEIGLYPDLEKKAPEVGAAYIHDHREEQQLMAQAVTTAQQTAAKFDSASQVGLIRLLSRFRGHVDAHVAKENELVVPLLIKLFSPEEQGAQTGRMIGSFPPAEMARVIPWMMQRLPHPKRVAYASMMAAVQPPPAFKGFAMGVKNGLSSEDWAALAAAVPQLNG